MKINKNLKIIGLIFLTIILIVGFVLLIVSVTINKNINSWIGGGILIAVASIGSIILWCYIAKDFVDNVKQWDKEIRNENKKEGK